MTDEVKTVVMNLMDDRTKVYHLPPDRAVVVAYEQLEEGNSLIVNYKDPATHPQFKEYRRGFACGDWIAYKKETKDTAA